jgi:hypothetical protein
MENPWAWTSVSVDIFVQGVQQLYIFWSHYQFLTVYLT